MGLEPGSGDPLEDVAAEQAYMVFLAVGMQACLVGVDPGIGPSGVQLAAVRGLQDRVTARSEDPEQLGQCLAIVGNMLQHVIGDDQVDRSGSKLHVQHVDPQHLR